MKRGSTTRSHLDLKGMEGDRNSDLYGVILAGGNGKRLNSFIKRNYGLDEPKQFIAFTGKRTMIQHTTDRIGRLIPKEKQFAVLDAKYASTIHHYLSDFPIENLVYQPVNRETAPGILLPLARVLKRNPNSHVAIFPSDHFILHEECFMEHVQMAHKIIHQFPDYVVLLGAQPEGPETEYGWIEPCETLLFTNGTELKPVKTFHEKPDIESAQRFFDNGYLWNTMIMIARGSTLWGMVLDTVPGLQSHFKNIYDSLGTAEEETVISREYEKMASVNISDSVLEKCPSHLLVLATKDVVWSDWGNESRVLETLNKIGISLNSNGRRVKRKEVVYI
ncbi:MAG: sugar phosphate nucleotidyltransferase [Nitrospiria bacterium]